MYPYREKFFQASVARLSAYMHPDQMSIEDHAQDRRSKDKLCRQ